MEPSPHAFLLSVCALGLTFLTAAVAPSELVTSVFAIAGVLLVLPVSIVLYLGYIRAVHAAGPEFAPGALTSFLLKAPIQLFGLLSLVVGIAIVGWVLYNSFVDRLSQYRGSALLPSLGIGPLLVAFGWHLVRRPIAH